MYRGMHRGILQFSFFVSITVSQIFNKHTCVYTYKPYIHNWSLQPFSQDYDLVSYTTYVVCVNFLIY